MTYFRLLNIQGIAGLAVSVCLALLLVIQKGDTRHWRKQSDQFQQLYRGEQAHSPGPSPITAPPPRPRAPPTMPPPSASAPSRRRSTKGAIMTFKHALPTLALMLTACASSPKAQPIPAVALARLCPAYPLPPAELIKPPVRTDFLSSEALIATEQAIQLDELIGWVRRQHSVNPKTPRLSPRTELRGSAATAPVDERVRTGVGEPHGPNAASERWATRAKEAISMSGFEDIREHMEVIGADGVHIGTVDRVEEIGSS